MTSESGADLRVADAACDIGADALRRQIKLRGVRAGQRAVNRAGFDPSTKLRRDLHVCQRFFTR
jgi:hypothetical protein